MLTTERMLLAKYVVRLSQQCPGFPEKLDPIPGSHGRCSLPIFLWSTWWFLDSSILWCVSMIDFLFLLVAFQGMTIWWPIHSRWTFDTFPALGGGGSVKNKTRLTIGWVTKTLVRTPRAPGLDTLISFWIQFPADVDSRNQQRWLQELGPCHHDTRNLLWVPSFRSGSGYYGHLGTVSTDGNSLPTFSLINNLIGGALSIRIWVCVWYTLISFR